MKIAVSLMTVVGLLSLSLPTAWAQESFDVTVLQGKVQHEGSSVSTGGDGSAVVTFPGAVRVRLASSTSFTVQHADGQRVELVLQSGQVYAQLPEQPLCPLVIHGPSSEVRATLGTFVYDITGPESSLRVLQGNAELSGPQVGFSLFRALPAVASLTVPAGLQAIAADVLGPVAVDQVPPGTVDPSGFGPVESMGQDEVKQDAKDLLAAKPQPPTTTGGFNPLLILGGLVVAGGLVGLVAGGGGGGGGSASGGTADGGATAGGSAAGGGTDGGTDGVPVSP